MIKLSVIDGRVLVKMVDCTGRGATGARDDHQKGKKGKKAVSVGAHDVLIEYKKLGCSIL